MANETLSLADIIMEDKPKELMKAIFPRWSDRMRAYGKLVIVPTFKNPLEAFPVFAALREKEEDDRPQPMSQATRNVIEWGLEGDRIAPEFKHTLEIALLVETAYEESYTE